jgi:hypothetical protein
VLRTLRTIFLLVLTLVFFGAGQSVGGYYEFVLSFLAACAGGMAFYTT